MEIYFDNAATSRFKPDGVKRAVMEELHHSVNSGRGGYSSAVAVALKIEKTREFLTKSLGARNAYCVFTKNCTEALNLAIRGFVKEGCHVIATDNEHNSVLRVLTELKSFGVIDFDIVSSNSQGIVELSAISEKITAKTGLIVVNYVSNVTGAVQDIHNIGRICRQNGVRFLVDGAQGVPLMDMDMTDFCVDMLAIPSHKGMHGVQGSGALLFDSDLALRPLLYGGTGTQSEMLSQPVESVEGYESGTLFSGGVLAFYEGAKWSIENKRLSAAHIKKLSGKLLDGLKDLCAIVYTDNPSGGVVSFNVGNYDSSCVANYLNEEYEISVRAGLHCAPLVHKRLGTLARGAVRVGVGVDNTPKEIDVLLNALEKLLRNNR